MQKSNRKGHLTLIERDKITILKSEGLSINKELNIVDEIQDDLIQPPG